jgi:small multidrug resistance pump
MMFMSWVSWGLLLAAIICEVIGTTSMKLSNGFTKLGPSLLMVLFYGLSLVALNFSLKEIPVGTAYAIWSGVGVTLIAVIGFMFFNEKISILKIGAIALIIIGITILYLLAENAA